MFNYKTQCSQNVINEFALISALESCDWINSEREEVIHRERDSADMLLIVTARPSALYSSPNTQDKVWRGGNMRRLHAQLSNYTHMRHMTLCMLLWRQIQTDTHHQRGTPKSVYHNCFAWDNVCFQIWLNLKFSNQLHHQGYSLVCGNEHVNSQAPSANTKKYIIKAK